MDPKQKNRLLMAGFLLLLAICYQFAIKNTLVQRAAYKKLLGQQQQLAALPSKSKLLEIKNAYYDSIIRAYQLSGASLENELLKSLNTLGAEHGFSVADFKEPHRYAHSHQQHDHTYIFTLQGPYHALLKGIYQLEQQKAFGQVIHMDFIKKKDFRAGRDYLQASVMLRVRE